MGALLDPLVDRLLVLSGVVVCWHFELLPRWGLALLAAREVFMLGLVRWAPAPRRSTSRSTGSGGSASGRCSARCSSRWPGLETVGAICLYIGLALVLASTAKYLRDGLAARPSSTG